MNFWKRELSAIDKDEEKVIFTIHKFKVRKKLFFSALLTMMIMMIGINKVSSLRALDIHISPTFLLLTFLVCSIFITYTVMRKNWNYYRKQISMIGIGMVVLTLIFSWNEAFSIVDVLFVSIIATTVAAAIYDIF